MRFIEHSLPDYIFLENVPGLQNVNKAAMLRSKTLLLHRDGVRSMAEEQAHLLGSPGREATTVIMLQADLVNLANVSHRHLQRDEEPPGKIHIKHTGKH